MKTRIRTLSLALVFSVAATGATLAQPAGPQGQQQKPQQGQPHASQQKQGVRPASPEFRAQDSKAARSYFQQHRQASPPLPHGTKLVVGQKRPPRVEYRDIPPPLLKQLPTHHGYRYYLAGDDLILVAVATGIIVDILTSVR